MIIFVSWEAFGEVALNLSPEAFNEYLNSLILKGDDEACLKIFDAIKPFVIKHGNQILRSFDITSGDMEDHMQDMYIELLKCIKRFEPARNVKFTFYVTGCIRNYFYNYAHKEKHKIKNEISLFKPMKDEEDIVLGDILEDERANVLEDIIGVETREMLAFGLRQLDEREKRIIYLYYVKRCTLLHIAEELGMNYCRVRYIHIKILQKLKNF